MRKIPTLLVRDPQDRRHVTMDVTPSCAWVLQGEGTPTRKWDGTCVMCDDAGAWWARREVKPGKTPPPGWIPVQLDETTGKAIGWEPITQSPFARWHAQAVGAYRLWASGTYELCGPKVNGNPEGLMGHLLVRHDQQLIGELAGALDVKSITEAVARYGRVRGWEGVVWHHPDGRMAKLKARDLADPQGAG